MPNTEPMPPAHASTEIINPVASAFQFYLLQLHEQYPGILAQFAVSDIEPGEPSAQDVPRPYQLEGRLFFKNFSIDNNLFEFTRHPLTQDQTKHILDPIKMAVHETEASLTQHAPVEDSLSKFSDLRHSVLQSTLFYLKETTGDTHSPDQHISLALNQSDALEDAIKLITHLQPHYTLANIKGTLDTRERINHLMLTSDGIHLLKGLLASGHQGIPTPLATQALGAAKVAGAILFKVISEIEIQMNQPLALPLKKFITKISNIGDSNIQNLFTTLREQHESVLKAIFTISPLLDALKEPNEVKAKSDIETTLTYLTTNLNSLANNLDFQAFQEHSFTILFSHFLESCHALAQHPPTKLAYQARILDFMTEAFAQYKAYPDVIPLAISLLETMHFPRKKHLHTNAVFKQHQDCLTRCQMQARSDALKRFSSTLKPIKIKDDADHTLEALVKKASDQRISAKTIKISDRTQSSFTLVNGDEESGKSRKEKFSRGLSHLNLFTTRPRTKSQETVETLDEENTSPKVSPRFRRKKHPRHEAEGQPTASSSPEPSPNTPRKPKHKARKTETAPPLFSSSPPKAHVAMPDERVNKTPYRQKRLSQ